MFEMNRIIEVGKSMLKGVLAFTCAGIGILGCYPVLPAYFAVCSMSGRASVWVFVGALYGAIYFMPVEIMVKYICLLLVIAVGMRLYMGMNRFCTNWSTAVLTGIAFLVMHYAAK